MKRTTSVFGMALITLLAYVAPVMAQDVIIPNISGVFFTKSTQDTSYAVTSDFAMHGITASPIDLTISYSASVNEFGMFGKVLLFVDGDSIETSLGEQDNPGFKIENDELSQIVFTSTKKFEVEGVGFSPKQMSFEFDDNADQFVMFGAMAVHVDGDSINASFGDASDPGVIIQSGEFDQVNISIAEAFSFKGLTMTPFDLTFTLETGSNKYLMFGTLDAETSTGDIFTAAGGEGMDILADITDGKVSQLSLGFTSDFVFRGLRISPAEMTFEWNQDRFVIYGGARVAVESDTLVASFGSKDNAGIEILNGAVQKVDIDVAAKFDLKDLGLSPRDLTFEWDETSSGFIMYGAVGVTIENDSLEATLGTASDPGILIVDGEVQHINFGVSANFDLKTLTITPTNMAFEWDKSTGNYIFYGDVIVATLGGDSFTGQLGSADNPGIQLVNGAVDHINLGVTADFSLKQMQFTPTNLTFQWDKAGDRYIIFGDLSASIENDFFAAHLGDENAPGVEIVNGDIQAINIGVTADFQLQGLQLSPTNLTFEWDSARSSYIIYGAVAASIEGDVLNASLGDATTPGIEVINGSLDHVQLGVTADFDLKNLEFMPHDLTFQWEKGQQKYVLFGDVDVTIEDDSLDVDLGDQTSPGIEIINGSLEQINIGVTANFQLKELSFAPNDLTFQWDKAQSQYIMFGGITATTQGGDAFVGQLGSVDNPGVIIKTGALEHINIGVSGDFHLKGLDFVPNAMTFEWTRASDEYVIYGDVSVTTAGGDTFQGLLGDQSNPGIEIIDGAVGHVNIGVTADFIMKQLQFTPTNLTFEWDKAGDFYLIYGDVSVAVEEDNLDANLGTKTNPGIEIKNGAVDFVDVGVTADFSMKGLTIKPNDLTFQWDKAADTYFIYGDIAASVEGDDIDAQLGDESNPGIEIINGAVDHINIDVTGDFDLKEVQFQPKNLTFEWDKANDKYVMFGDVDVTVEGDSIDVDLGGQATPGLEITNGAIDFIHLGVTGDFELKSLIFSPTDLTFEWEKAAGKYVLFGEVTTSTAGGDSLDGLLGTADNPGIEITNGAVDHINIGVTADFHLKGLDFAPQDLTFKWTRTTNQYIIYGDVAITTQGGDSFEGHLGDQSDPGVEITNGAVDHINVGVTADFTMKQLHITPTDLTFEWDKTSDHYLIYGDVSIAIEDDKLEANLGTSEAPGIEIIDGAVDFVHVGVTAEFTLKSMQIHPIDMTFEWDKASDFYIIYGDIVANVESDSIAAQLGDETNPGIEIKNGAVDHIDIGVSALFHLKGLEIRPQELTFQWDKANDKFIMLGDVDVAVEGDSIDVDLGDQSTPGIEIVAGAVDFIQFGFTGNFDMKEMTFSPTDLTFQWDKAQNLYEIYGAVIATTLGGDSFDGVLGSSDNPGILIDQGTLAHINVGVNANFDLNGLTFAPAGLTLEWTRANDSYIIYGEVTVSTVGGDSFDGHLGDAADPGIEIVNGSVDNINVGVTADFDLKALTFSPKDLTFQWGKDDDRYVIFGEVMITTEGGDTFDGLLGDESDPGVAISNGSVEHINLGITADFQLSDLTFAPTDLTFEWDKASDHYLIYGDVLVAVEDDSLDALLGDQADPGIEIIDGAVDHINMGITADFRMKGLEIAPQGLTFEWDKEQDKYLIYGELDVTLEDDTFDALLGTQADPGLEIINGEVDHINIGVTADFNMKGLDIAPKGLTFEWDKEQDKYLIYGEVDATMEGDTFDALLGTQSDPGIEIVNGSVDHINIGVTADFDLKGLDINPQGLTIEWDSAEYGDSGVNRYLFYGALNLTIEGDVIDAGFGTRSSPGLFLENGVIKHILVDINSDLTFGNLEVEAKDLTLEYQNDIYHLTGAMLAKEVWKAEINLGQGSQAGVELDVSGDSDTFILEDVIFLIEHAELGSIDFKRIELEFKNNTISECDLMVSFPPGWMVEGDIKFVGNPAKVHEVTLDWEAENIDEAIEIAGTGAVLMYLSGDINNLDNPSELTFTGDIGVTYGGPFDVDGHELALIHMDDTVEISKSYLKVGGDIGIGSYQSGSTWHNELGYGDVNFQFYWHDYYKIYGKLKIPSDPMIEATADVLISASGNFDALVDVEFIVPHFVPYIHGKHFGSVDGAIRYLHGHPTSSYAAGWTKVDLWLTSFYIGAKYNMGTKHIGKIGSGTIKSIKKQIHSDGGLAKANGAAGGGFTTLTQTFTLDAPSPTFSRIHLGWPTAIDTAYVVVTGPEGHLNLIPITVQDDGDSTSMPIITAGENLTTVVNDTTVEFLLASSSSIRNENDAEKAPLAPGQYQVGFYYQGNSGIDSLSITADRLYPQPSGSLTTKENKDGSVDLDLSYEAYIPDSCIVSIFWNDTTNYNGRLVAHIPYGEVASDGSGSATFNFAPTELHADEDLLFYMVVDDHLNTPVYSDFTPMVVYDPPMYGNVKVVDADSLRGGITVFIDDSGNGKFDINGPDSTEASCVTDGDGDFSFHRLYPDTYTIDIVVPHGYELDASSPTSVPVSVDYAGQPVQLNFILRKSQ
jgi:hypothetical protein